ncbi:MAG: hypothetical protein K2G30_08760 [Muribaculaceae bacterium]|nr:hypothetical protein [Muribaculaceae bacterium]MDE7142353.1 hypothetical protein [Muribaculaceae bacterium]
MTHIATQLLDLTKYLIIAYMIFLAISTVGKFAFFSSENLKQRRWKDLLWSALLLMVALFVAWMCLSAFGITVSILPPFDQTPILRWFTETSIGIRWQTCAKILGGVYIAALWGAFAVIWRIVFKRVRRIRSKITNKQDKPAVIGMAVICALTAGVAFLTSSTIWKAAVEVGNIGPDEPATVGKVLLLTFFALLWGRVIAALGISTHKSIHRGRRRDYAELALSGCLVAAVSYISWLLVPTI